MEKLDFTLQNSNMLLPTCRKHAANGDTEGISGEQIEVLSGQIEDASSKDTAQKQSLEVVATLTVKQNEIAKRGEKSIQRIKEAAKGEYGEDDKARMKEFHVGTEIPSSVKRLVLELKYISLVAVANKADLAKRGIKDEQIAQLASTADELTAADAEQEAAKKRQKAATKERDAAMKSLQKTIRKIQHTAKSVFADQPSVLIEFESISKRRGTGGQINASPPAGPAAQ